jgi:hypothetical protein
MYGPDDLELTRNALALALQSCNYKWAVDAFEEASKQWILDEASRPSLMQAMSMLMDAMVSLVWTADDLRAAYKAFKHGVSHNLFRFPRYVRDFLWSPMVMQSVTVFYSPDCHDATHFVTMVLQIMEQMVIEWQVPTPYFLPELTLCNVPWETCEPVFALAQPCVRFRHVTVLPGIEEHQRIAEFLLM